MQTRIAKWGNSLALRLPRGAVQDANLVEGSEVDVRVEGDRIIVTPTRRKYTLDHLLEQLGDEERHTEVEWGPPKGREAW